MSDLSPIDSPETFAGWHMPWPRFEVDWARAALVLIDMQNYGCNPDVGLMQMLSERYPEIARYYMPRVTDTAVPMAGCCSTASARRAATSCSRVTARSSQTAAT